MQLSEILKTELTNNCNEFPIRYSCGTTSCNGEYINITIGSTPLPRIEGDNLKPFIAALENSIKELTTEYPFLHTITKKLEFHFYYHGFNSCFIQEVPISISNINPDLEPKKTGIVSEKYSQVGTSKVMEVINSHPGYELYKRSGFAFRGAQEQKTDINGIKALCEWACCLDIRVIDNEIHVNGFSVNDMY